MNYFFETLGGKPILDDSLAVYCASASHGVPGTYELIRPAEVKEGSRLQSRSLETILHKCEMVEIIRMEQDGAIIRGELARGGWISLHNVQVIFFFTTENIYKYTNLFFDNASENNSKSSNFFLH